MLLSMRLKENLNLEVLGMEDSIVRELKIMNDLKALDLFLTGVRQEKIDKIFKKWRK